MIDLKRDDLAELIEVNVKVVADVRVSVRDSDIDKQSCLTAADSIILYIRERELKKAEGLLRGKDRALELLRKKGLR